MAGPGTAVITYQNIQGYAGSGPEYAVVAEPNQNVFTTTIDKKLSDNNYPQWFIGGSARTSISVSNGGYTLQFPFSGGYIPWAEFWTDTPNDQLINPSFTASGKYYYQSNAVDGTSNNQWRPYYDSMTFAPLGWNYAFLNSTGSSITANYMYMQHYLQTEGQFNPSTPLNVNQPNITVTLPSTSVFNATVGQSAMSSVIPTVAILKDWTFTISTPNGAGWVSNSTPHGLDKAYPFIGFYNTGSDWLPIATTDGLAMDSTNFYIEYFQSFGATSVNFHLFVLVL